MKTNMRSVRLEGNGAVRLVEVPNPVPKPGEVLIETAISALCGSELHTYRGAGMKSGNTGHEGAGVVVELGEGVSHLQVGQRVGVSAIAGCGECSYCEKGQYTWCSQRRFYGNMHAARFLAAANACQVLPDDVPWEVGVLISGDGLGVPFHTSTKIDSPTIRTIAIFGTGPIGLGNTLMQAYLGRQVIAVDLSKERLALARKLGAEHALNPKEGDVVERTRALTGGMGVDVAIEAAGRPETVKQCFAAVHPGGTVVFNGEQSTVELSPSEDFIRRDITAVGSWYYHYHEFDSMVALYREGLRVQDLITHHYSLAEADAAFRQFASAKTGKVLLHARDCGFQISDCGL